MRHAELVVLVVVSVLIGYGCKKQEGQVKSNKQYKIAFTSGRDGNREIYVMNADGSEQKRLTNNAAVDAEPRWSPDGKKIAFASHRSGSSEIYVISTDGSGQKNLTNSSPRDIDAQWSPDGKKIAFLSVRPSLRIPFLSVRDDRFYICVMNADGSKKKQLTDTASDLLPVWSRVPMAAQQP
jgi:Tol biopolymer transport system component